MKLSARNQLKGTIVGVDVGPVSGRVSVDIGGGQIVTSTITSAAVKDLGLEVGKEVYAVFKSSSVMIGVDH